MIINPYIFASSYDADAQAFITAAGITDTTQKNAVNQLVLDLKGYSIWTKFKAIYPIVGGTASSHAVNLKNPGTYNLTFSSGYTHSSTGMKGNGTSAYANTNLNATTGTILSQNNVHVSIYSRTNSTSNYIMDLSAGSEFYLGIRYGVTYPGIISNMYTSGFNGFASNSNSLGFVIISRTNSTTSKQFQNNTLLRTDTRTTSSYSLTTVNISRNSNNSEFSNREYAFASIGDGLTDTEASNFYTAVQAFQTTLSRQV